MFTQTACSPQTITKNLEYCVLEHILIVSSVSPNAAAEAGTKEENVDEKRFLTLKAKNSGNCLGDVKDRQRPAQKELTNRTGRDSAPRRQRTQQSQLLGESEPR